MGLFAVLTRTTYNLQPTTYNYNTAMMEMSTTAAAASLAAVSGLAAYLNAKYHVAQDLRLVRFKRKSERFYEELGMCFLRLRFASLSYS